MDLCARPPGRTRHPSVLPDERFSPFPFFRRLCHVLRSLLRYAFGPFRSPAGPSLPLNDFRPFRSLAGTGRALSHVGRSPAGRGRRAGTGLRPYPSHCATLVGPSRSPAGTAVPPAERYWPFPFSRRLRRGVAGGCRGGRARSRPSGSRLQAGGLGWYAPSGLSFPLRFACGPLPLTRPRVAMPSSAPCLSGSYALRAVHRCFHNILNCNNL